MKPFAARNLNAKRRIYNYRHSRARRTVEYAFGILASKFEIFQRPMRVAPDKVIIITKATVGLHNFIRHGDGNKFNDFFLVVIHFGSIRHKKRAMQQSKARNVSSRLCRAVNGVCNSKSLCLIFFRTRAMCYVPCAECHVTSMEGPPYSSL
ncbi:hypothetical protein PoB_004480700 [Plakobranchus ocellatus]|uniref:DDE Tnp4 domain-containing protein n=1 Tax=Plakobranchus ocellatus TaxID=259542 RepID=A0AAV4BH50_9GAST|nr:hypothetical protein PoB_004480700 [Plakobranchus ocellatus]